MATRINSCANHRDGVATVPFTSKDPIPQSPPCAKIRLEGVKPPTSTSSRPGSLPIMATRINSWRRLLKGRLPRPLFGGPIFPMGSHQGLAMTHGFILGYPLYERMETFGQNPCKDRRPCKIGVIGAASVRSVLNQDEFGPHDSRPLHCRRPTPSISHPAPK